MRKTAIILALLLLLLTLSLSAAEFPRPQGYVNDFAGVIDNDSKQQMEGIMSAVERATGAEIAVLVVQSIEPYGSIEEYGVAIASEWGIGKEGADNGALLLLSMKERKIRFRFQIEKTYGRYRSYPEEIERYISNKLIKNTEAIRGKDFFGTLCHAGQYFFVIHVDGRVTRCYNSHPLYYEMGNMARGTFRSLKETAPCLSRMCTFTVPANRNMICYGRKANFFVVTQASLRSWMQTAQKGGGT